MTSAPDDTHRGSAAPAITALGAPLLFPLLFPELEQEEQSRDEQKADHHQKDVRTANPPSTARLACSGSSLRHVPRRKKPDLGRRWFLLGELRSSCVPAPSAAERQSEHSQPR